MHNLLSSLMSSAAPKSRSFQSLSIDTPLTNDTTCIHAASCKMGARVRAITASRHVATTSYDAVSSAPAIRWEASDGLDVRALYGAFMQQIDQFDQTAFHLPPAEADVMDPHQRLALEERGRVVHVAPPRGQAAAAAFASAFRALVARSVRRIRTSPGHGCTVLGVVLCQLFKTLSTPFPALTRRYRRRGGAAPRPIASYASIGAIRGVGDALRRLPRCVDQTRRMQGCQSGWGRREVS